MDLGYSQQAETGKLLKIKCYSGGTPEFIEGDVFRTVIPLTPIAAEKVGP